MNKEDIEEKTKFIKSDLADTRYNIEFAHIYTDEVFNTNHIASAEILKEIISLNLKNFSTSVLIDNYNAPAEKFSTQDFLDSLNEQGTKPDYYVYEADLIEAADQFLKLIQKPKIVRMYASYIKRKGKYPCSLLTATWYLIRLGYIDGSKIVKLNNGTSINDFVADKIINILPTSFQGIEKDAYKIIGHSTFSDARFKIQPILFKEKEPVRSTNFSPERVETVPA